jgi:hypothetical protein
MSTSTLILIVAAVIVVLGVVLIVMASRRRSLKSLPTESKQRYVASWRAIEARFIEDPRAAVAEADTLAVSILQERGATLEDERRLPADLTRAREAARNEDGQGTEGMRTAMLRYQAIVDDAVGESMRKQETRRPEVA